MSHRDMAALASVGLAEKPWHSASLAWLDTLPASAPQTRPTSEVELVANPSNLGG